MNQELYAYIIIFVLSFGTGFLVSTEIQYSEDKSVALVEKYKDCFLTYYGQPASKRAFQSCSNSVNVPAYLFNENITIKQALEAYDNYKPVSTAIVRTKIRELCQP